jgi:cysteine-rich repeat protein
MPPNGNLCRPQTCTYCGDHIQDPGEQCDDGNNNNNDGCLNNCTLVPNVTCSFAPDGTTLIRGGTLRFWTTVQNNEGTTQTFKFATKVKLPNGNMYPLFLVGPKDVTLNSGQSASKQLSHTIPGTAPFGTYTYYGYVGNAPPAVEYGRCQFTFTVVQ